MKNLKLKIAILFDYRDLLFKNIIKSGLQLCLLYMVLMLLPGIIKYKSIPELEFFTFERMLVPSIIFVVSYIAYIISFCVILIFEATKRGAVAILKEKLIKAYIGAVDESFSKPKNRNGASNAK